MNDNERCQTCKHWARDIDQARGVCQLISGYDQKPPTRLAAPLATLVPARIVNWTAVIARTNEVTRAKLTTHPHFGCVQWEP